VWTELVAPAGAEVVASYADGPVAGAPALTRHGTAWYLTTRLTDADLTDLLADVAAGAGAARTLPGAPAGLDAVRRVHPDGRSYLFLLNAADQPAEVDAAGVDLLTGASWPGPTPVDARGVVVLRERER
jgi:beta-galactosidase